jgi:hypothetical protein
MTLILLSFAALYVLISLRDALGDLRFIFEARLLRRITRRHIIWATLLAVLFFALVLVSETPLADWPVMAILFASVVGGLLLIRTTVKDMSGDFQRRRIRGLSRNRFSLRHLLELTGLVALAFAIIRSAQMPPIDWPFAFMFVGFCYGAYLLIRLAITDVTFRGSKRRYSSRCPRSNRPQEAPDIQL